MPVTYISTAQMLNLSGLNPALVLCRLCEVAGPDGLATASLRDLGRDTKIDPGHISRHIAELQKHGLIKKLGRNPEGANMFRIVHLAARGAVDVDERAHPTAVHVRALSIENTTESAAPSDSGQQTPTAVDRPIMCVSSPDSGVAAGRNGRFFHARGAASSGGAAARAMARQDGAQAKCVPPLTLPPAQNPSERAPLQQRAQLSDAAAQAKTRRGHERGDRIRMLNELRAKVADAVVPPPTDDAERERSHALMTDRTVRIEWKTAWTIATLVPYAYVSANVEEIRARYEGSAVNKIPGNKFFGALCGDWAGWIVEYVTAQVREQKAAARAERARHEQEERAAGIRALQERAAQQLRALEHLRPSQVRRLIDDAIDRLPREQQGKARALLSTRGHLLQSPRLRDLAFDEFNTNGVPAERAVALAV